MQGATVLMTDTFSVDTLRGALAFFLEDDNVIDRFEADGLASLLIQDGQLSEVERHFLNEAMASANFTQEALDLLKGLLERADLAPGALKEA